MIPYCLIFCKTSARCGKLEPVAPVAQWIRASVFGTEGRGFESLRVYQIGVSRFFCCGFSKNTTEASARNFIDKSTKKW